MRQTRYHDLPFHDLPAGEYRAEVRLPALEITRENMRYVKEKFGITFTAGADVEGYAVDASGVSTEKMLDMTHLYEGHEKSIAHRYFGSYGSRPYFAKIDKEAGQGQYEVSTQMHPPDFIAMLFAAIRLIATRDAKKYGVDYIDFGDKPFPSEGGDGTIGKNERAGNAGHVHIGAVDELGNNIFNCAEKYSYHPLAYHVANTMLPLLRDATLIFGATEASYDRFKGIMNNPETIAFGSEKKKGTALRITYGEGPHFEVRYGGASMDPYLAMAVITSAFRQALDEHVKVEVRPTPPPPPPKPPELDWIEKLALLHPAAEKILTWTGLVNSFEMNLIRNPTPPPVAEKPETYRHLVTPQAIIPATEMARFPIPNSLAEAQQIFRDSEPMQQMLGKLHGFVLEYYANTCGRTKEAEAPPRDAPTPRMPPPAADWSTEAKPALKPKSGWEI
jgi:hypothetical protein